MNLKFGCVDLEKLEIVLYFELGISDYPVGGSLFLGCSELLSFSDFLYNPGSDHS